MEWPKPSSVRSSVTTSASVRARMHRPSCTSSQLGLITTTRFTRTRHSDIVHPVSLSQLAEARDRVRSFGGYNSHVVAALLAAKRPSIQIAAMRQGASATLARWGGKGSNGQKNHRRAHPALKPAIAPGGSHGEHDRKHKRVAPGADG